MKIGLFKELNLIHVFNSTCIHKMEKINLKVCLIFVIQGEHLNEAWGKKSIIFRRTSQNLKNNEFKLLCFVHYVMNHNKKWSQ